MGNHHHANSDGDQGALVDWRGDLGDARLANRPFLAAGVLKKIRCDYCGRFRERGEHRKFPHCRKELIALAVALLRT